MATYLQAFKTAQAANPNITIREFDKMIEADPTLVSTKPVNRLETPEGAEVPLPRTVNKDCVIYTDKNDILEIENELAREIDHVYVPEEAGLNPVLFHKVEGEVENEEEVEEEEEDDLPLYMYDHAEVVETVTNPEDDFRPAFEYFNVDYDDMRRDPTAKGKGTVTLKIKSSVFYDQQEWYRQLHALEIGMRWSEESTKWPLTFRFIQKAKSVKVTYRLPYGVSRNSGITRRESIVASVKPYLRKDFGLVKVHLQTNTTPYDSLVPLNEKWSDKRERLTKKYVKSIVQKFKSD